MNKPQRIGILTFHKCFNYGAYWQARCLAEGIQAMGHHAVILDHWSWAANIAEWKCGFLPFKRNLRALADCPAYSRKLLAFERARARLPLSHSFPLDRPVDLASYDLVVVGSDEVWNTSHAWYGGKTLFFGIGLRCAALVAHAASFGSHSAREPLAPSLADGLRRFASITVRDMNSQAIVQNATGLKPDIVLDPCLHFEPSSDTDGGAPLQPYAVVYGVGFSPAFARCVTDWARANDILLVSVGYRNDWADEHRLFASPDDFVQLMRRAQAVATNYFHGCVFALRYARPFLCETTPYREIKIRDLLATLGADRHRFGQCDAEEACTQRLSEPLSQDILVRIEALRESSQARLEQTLAGKASG
jgi:hypothetical protein